jgi:hypothetical protein
METVHYEHNIASIINSILFLRFVIFKVHNVRVITRVNLMKGKTFCSWLFWAFQIKNKCAKRSILSAEGCQTRPDLSGQ